MRPHVKKLSQYAALVCGVGIALLLVGCAQEGFDPQRSVGAWKHTDTLEKMEATFELPEAAKAAIGITNVSDPFCLTSQSVSADTLESRLTNIAVLGPEWKMGTITVTGGDLAAVATGPLGKITYSGKISNKISDLTITMVASDSVQGTATTIQRHRVEHIGPCTPEMGVMGQ